MVELSKGINFIPEFIVKENEKKKRKVMIATITAIITLFGICIYFIPEYELFILNTKSVKINTEINNMQDIKNIKQQLDETKEKLDAKKKILEEIRSKESDVELITKKLLAITPSNVVLDYYNITDGKTISVNYIINTPEDMVELTNRLKGLELFEKVEIPVMPIVDRKANVNFRLKLAKSVPVVQVIKETPAIVQPPADTPVLKATESKGVSVNLNLAVPTVSITKNSINKKYYLNITGMGSTYEGAAVYTATSATELLVDSRSDGREPTGKNWTKMGVSIKNKSTAVGDLGIVKGSGVKYIVIKVAKNTSKGWGLAYSKVIPWDDKYLNASE